MYKFPYSGGIKSLVALLFSDWVALAPPDPGTAVELVVLVHLRTLGPLSCLDAVVVHLTAAERVGQSRHLGGHVAISDYSTLTVHHIVQGTISHLPDTALDNVVDKGHWWLLQRNRNASRRFRGRSSDRRRSRRNIWVGNRRDRSRPSSSRRWHSPEGCG